MRSAAPPSGAPRLIDMTLGRRGRAQGHAGRQGRLLRHRRPRHQARQRHAADEEGHGRRRERAGARPHDHGARPQAAPARADPGGRECDLRRCVPAARRLSLAQGAHRRDRQHRRRRPPGPRRRAGARRRGDARPAGRHGHADRRRARRARSRSAAVLHRRRGRSRPRSRGTPAPRTIRCGGCRCGPPTTRCSTPRSPT